MKSLSIQRRILVAMFAVSVTTSVGTALWIASVSESLEHTLLTTIVSQEADFLDELLSKNPDARLTESATVLAWLESPPHAYAPPAIQHLPAGIHHDIKLNGSSYHVLRRQSPHGLITVAMEINAVEAREDSLRWVLILGALLIPLATLILGWYIAKSIAAPVRRLATSVRKRHPGLTAAPLAPAFQNSELTPVAVAIDAYQSELDEFIQRERQFSAAASHELRTPLAVMRSSLELLSHDELPLPNQKRVLRLENAVLQMQTVVEGLLALVNDNVGDIAEVNICPIIENVVERYKGDFAARNIELRVVAPMALEKAVLPAHLDVMLSNLLSNALHHLQPQSTIPPWVEVKLTDSALCVSDNGIPPSKEALLGLFDWGQKAPKSAGSGLGLYIVKHIASHYGWQTSAAINEQQQLGFNLTF